MMRAWQIAAWGSMQSRERWLFRCFAWSIALLGGGACAETPLPTPAINVGVGGNVRAIARLPDGDIVLGGLFTSIDGVPRRNLARLHADGTLDMNWAPAADDMVTVLAADASGDVYAGGFFASIDSVPRNHLAKLSGQGRGSVNAEWNGAGHVTGIGSVDALALNARGDVFFAGDISVSETTSRRIAKFSGIGSGALDAAWNPQLPSAAIAMVTDGNGSIYVSAADSGQECCLYKFADGGSGAEVAGSRPALDGVAAALAMAPDGSLYAGARGLFLQQRSLLRLLPGDRGEIDSTWMPTYTESVYALTVDAAGAVYAHLDAGTNVPSRIVKLTRAPDGNISPNWEIPSSDANVLAASAGSLFVGGNFSYGVNVPGRLSLARLSTADGSLLPSGDALLPGSVYALAFQADGGMIVGGRFRRADATPRNNLLRLKPDGSLDADWNPGSNLYAVFALAIDAQNNVYAGGYPLSSSVPSVAKLQGAGNGAADPTWSAPLSAYGEVYALALDGNGGFYVGGRFSSVAGTPQTNVAKLLLRNGTVDSAWKAEMEYPVRAIAVRGDAVYLGSGDIQEDNGSLFSPQFFGALAKLSNSTGAQAGVDGWIRSLPGALFALAPAADGSFYAGGIFRADPTSNAFHVLKLTQDGLPDPHWTTSFSPPDWTQHVTALLLDPWGDIRIGWSGPAREGQSTALATLSSATGAVVAEGPPMDGSEIGVLTLGPDGQLYVGGNFTQIEGQPRGGLAALPLRDGTRPWRWARPLPPVLRDNWQRAERPTPP